MLVKEKLTEQMVSSATFFLQSALESFGVDEEACVYSLFNGSHCWYIGKALLRRKKDQPGIPARIMEHLTSVLRKGSQAGRSIRAVLLRQMPPSNIGFLIVKRGLHEWIKAAETMLIRNLRPLGNKGQCASRKQGGRRKRRKRPPPRFRQHRRSRSIWEMPRSFFQVCDIVQRRRRQFLASQPPLWTSQSFREAYRRKQREIFARTGKLGPLFIYGRSYMHLLAVWACSKHSSLDKRIWFRCTQAGRAVVHLARLVSMMPGYVRRANGFWHVDRLLKTLRLPGRHVHWFKCPDASSMTLARRALKHAASCMSRQHVPFLYRWMMEKVRFCRGKALRFLDRRNATQASKEIDVAEICRKGVFAAEHWMRGEEILRLHGNWSIVDRQQQVESYKQLETDFKTWLRCQHCSKQATRAGLHILRKGKQQMRPDLAPEAEYAYISDMMVGQNEVLLQDDKDKKCTWTMPFACLAAFLLVLVLRDRQWEPTDMSLHNLHLLVYGVSMYAVPSYLRKGPLRRGSCAPYMYPFVKSKCFSASGGRTCTKQGHSCLRKVVSFFKAPWRRAWRLAGRALQVLVIQTGAGFSIWQLKDIVPVFKRRFSKLRCGPSIDECVRCQRMKRPTTFLVADAAQMYEQVDMALVLQAFDAKSAALLGSHGVETITVKKGRSFAGWCGGAPQTRSGTVVVFSMSILRRMLVASSYLRFASIGDLVVRAKGLVIGGLLSMISAGCLLSHEEAQFMKGEGPGAALTPPGWSLEQLLLGMRYVDDLLLVSCALCHGCLHSLVQAIYSVTFEVEPESHENTWTDVVFHDCPRTGRVAWIPKNPNRGWIRGSAAKSKQRYPPYLGRLQCAFGILRGMLLGRLARLQELELGEANQARFFLEEFEELILEGYPLGLLRALVHSLGIKGPALFKVRQAIRALEACKG